MLDTRSAAETFSALSYHSYRASGRGLWSTVCDLSVRHNTSRSLAISWVGSSSLDTEYEDTIVGRVEEVRGRRSRPPPMRHHPVRSYCLLFSYCRVRSSLSRQIHEPAWFARRVAIAIKLGVWSRTAKSCLVFLHSRYDKTAALLPSSKGTVNILVDPQ